VQRPLQELEAKQADFFLNFVAHRGCREQNDSARGVQPANLDCRFYSIDALHANIDQNNVGPEFLRLLNGSLAAVEGFGFVSMKTQDFGQCVCYDRLVIYDCHSRPAYRLV